MKRFLLLAAVLCLLFSCASGEEEYVPTAAWLPPSINEQEALSSAPWLLVLKVAQEEIGYVEGPGSNESKYGAWFGEPYCAWCAEFLTWCVNEADQRYGTSMLHNLYPFYGRSSEGAPWFIQRERFVCAGTQVPGSHEKMWLIGADRYIRNKEYVPKPGDYMWITYHTMETGSEHVAIVEGVSREPDGSLLVHVIEGNNPDRVTRATYKQDWKMIYGYGVPERRAHRILRNYCSSDDCIVIQQYLADLGFMAQEAVAETLGPAGVRALRDYQKQNHLTVNGMADLETRTFMEQDPLFRDMIDARAR